MLTLLRESIIISRALLCSASKYQGPVTHIALLTQTENKWLNGNEWHLSTGLTISQQEVPTLVELNFSIITGVGQKESPHYFCLKALELQRLSDYSWLGALFGFHKE